jgi:hypothetical protein
MKKKSKVTKQKVSTKKQVETTASTPTDPTVQAYSELRTAFRYYNNGLFEGALPDCLITLYKLRKGAAGHFARSRFVKLDDRGTHTDEIG